MIRLLLKPQTLVTLGTYGLPFAVAGGLLALNTGISGGPLEFRAAKWAGLFWLSVAAIVSYLVLLFICHRMGKANRREQFWVPLLAGLFVVILALAVLEIGIRVVAKPHPFGRQIGPLVLKSYEWDVTKNFNRELYENSLDSDAYYVGHSTFGWTIGSSRTSKDGLYASSTEGLRSQTAGDELMPIAAGTRIALFGDSFMFSEEVGYDDSLAHHLQNRLSDTHQVLNFGVPGYGIDQAYLTFTERSDRWSPRVAILGFIADDLIRAVNVYAFLKPTWGIPFSKPKFVLDEDQLELLNVPNIAPEKMFEAEFVSDLPHLSHDIEYFDFDWQRHVLHSSMIYRLLISAFPRYAPDNPNTSEEAISEIGARISSRFVKSATDRGITPVVLYLPSRTDFAGGEIAIRDSTIQRASELGIEIIDMTDCLSKNLDTEALFVTGGVHYSGEGNREFAQCLTDLVPALKAAAVH